MVTREPDILPTDKFSVSQCAATLGVGRSTIYRAAKDGRLRARLTRSATRIFFLGRDVLAYWRSNV